MVQVCAQYQFWAVDSTQGWGPSACLQTWEGVADGFCTGTATCTQPPDNAGCIGVGNVRVCEGDPLSDSFPPPPAALPGIPRLCGAIRLETECAYHLGALDCWIDPQGVQHCPVNEAAIPPPTPARCWSRIRSVASSSPTVSTAPAGPAEPAMSSPILTIVALPPASPPRPPPPPAVPGPAALPGEDCITPTPEQNTDFARAAAAFQAAQALVADMTCGDLSGHEGVTEACRLFTGEAMECKKAVGGQVDCCECPGGVSLADYVTLMLAALKLDSAITSWNSSTAAGQALQGAWTTLREPIVQSWSTVTDLFTSAVESIGGSVTKEAASGMMEQISGFSLQQTLMNAAAKLIGEVFGEAARDALFTASTEQVGGQMVTTTP